MTNDRAFQEDFEQRAHRGYISYGQSMTDGFYAPEPLSATRRGMRKSVPLTPEYFRWNTDFRPSQDETDRYNACFHVGQFWRPEELEVAVAWQLRGEDGLRWKTYAVTGTRHAHFLIRKLAARNGFVSARLCDWLLTPEGYRIENVLSFTETDVARMSDRFRALLDRANTNYDLERDNRERQEAARRETAADRAAWAAQDR